MASRELFVLAYLVPCLEPVRGSIGRESEENGANRSELLGSHQSGPDSLFTLFTIKSAPMCADPLYEDVTGKSKAILVPVSKGIARPSLLVMIIIGDHQDDVSTHKGMRN